MKYNLIGVITNSAVYKQNEDGTITATGIGVQISIEGAPSGKFIQSDPYKDETGKASIIIPANTPASGMEAYIATQAQAYVARVYPNS